MRRGWSITASAIIAGPGGARLPSRVSFLVYDRVPPAEVFLPHTYHDKPQSSPGPCPMMDTVTAGRQKSVQVYDLAHGEAQAHDGCAAS